MSQHKNYSLQAGFMLHMSGEGKDSSLQAQIIDEIIQRVISQGSRDIPRNVHDLLPTRNKATAEKQVISSL
jgi:uncharacterized Fe-S center protein